MLRPTRRADSLRWRAVGTVLNRHQPAGSTRRLAGIGRRVRARRVRYLADRGGRIRAISGCCWAGLVGRWARLRNAARLRLGRRAHGLRRDGGVRWLAFGRTARRLDAGCNGRALCGAASARRLGGRRSTVGRSLCSRPTRRRPCRGLRTRRVRNRRPPRWRRLRTSPPRWGRLRNPRPRQRGRGFAVCRRWRGRRLNRLCIVSGWQDQLWQRPEPDQPGRERGQPSGQQQADGRRCQPYGMRAATSVSDEDWQLVIQDGRPEDRASVMAW